MRAPCLRLVTGNLLILIIMLLWRSPHTTCSRLHCLQLSRKVAPRWALRCAAGGSAARWDGSDPGPGILCGLSRDDLPKSGPAFIRRVNQDPEVTWVSHTAGKSQKLGLEARGLIPELPSLVPSGLQGAFRSEDTLRRKQNKIKQSWSPPTVCLLVTSTGDLRSLQAGSKGLPAQPLTGAVPELPPNSSRA